MFENLRRWDGTHWDWDWGPVSATYGPCALSVWIGLLLITMERQPFRVSLLWNPD